MKASFWCVLDGYLWCETPQPVGTPGLKVCSCFRVDLQPFSSCLTWCVQFDVGQLPTLTWLLTLLQFGTVRKSLNQQHRRNKNQLLHHVTQWLNCFTEQDRCFTLIFICLSFFYFFKLFVCAEFQISFHTFVTVVISTWLKRYFTFSLFLHHKLLFVEQGKK